MEQYVIKGGNPLVGEVEIAGAKNAALAILAAAIMTDETILIENLPDVRDINVLLEAIAGIGAQVDRIDKSTVKINGSTIGDVSVDYEYIKKIRASYYLLGALLGKYKHAEVPLPGGCNIGSRPIDQHLKGFRAASGFDYIALGHIHKPQILIRDNAAYAGALEPVDRNDLGDHGYIEGHLENGRLKTNFVPFACRSYEQILLMLREDSTQASLEDMLKADLANKGRMNIYRIVIQGTRAPELLLLPERLKSFGYVTEVLDESKPSYDLEALQKKYSGTLIGDYISYFLEKDRNAVEEKALYYGLQALLETSR